MISVGPKSLNFPFGQKSPNQTPDVVDRNRSNGDVRDIRSAILEKSNRIQQALSDLHIRQQGCFTSVWDLHMHVKSGDYDFAFIDYQLGKEVTEQALKEIAHPHSNIPVVIIDGPVDLLKSGASDCFPLNELTSSRLSTILYNSERFKSLRQTAGTLFSDIGALQARDPLTTLISRPSFKSRLQEVVKNSATDNSPVSLIVLDIDSFKGLNESKGHDFGDLVLKTVSERLLQFAPENSVLARLGDDEFALLLYGNHLAKISDTTIAARLSHELRQPYFLDGQSTTLSATMGIAKLDTHDTPASLLHKSTSALYSAKREKNRFMVYTKQEDTERRQQLKLAQELPDAIEGNQLRLHYQPMIRMHDSTVIGVEALVRWQHPQKGLLFPDSFIPLAEGSGSVEPLTRWVLDAAIRQASLWHQQGHRLTVSVNISALILHNPIFPDIVNRLLEQAIYPAEYLKLEITESAIISDVVRATDVVTRLHELGVKVSIDDFGTGYTSLAYIRKLPVDEIKIDKSFVLNMNTVSDDAVIVRTLLELARNLDLSVVAEGVEDRETWYMLAGLGCHVAQGYYMSRPVDVEALETWLKHSPWASSR